VAVAFFDKALAIKPDYAVAWKICGFVLAKLGEQIKPLNHLTKH